MLLFILKRFFHFSFSKTFFIKYQYNLYHQSFALNLDLKFHKETINNYCDFLYNKKDNLFSSDHWRVEEIDNIKEYFHLSSKIKIKIVGAENFLQNILMSKGILTETNITKNNLNCIELGVKTCSKIGNNDIGQACIISNNEVIITEDINGTDYMLYRALKEKHNDISGGFLIKMLKPIQDPRVDLPTVGLNTLRLINELGLDGIILEDKKAFLIDKKKMIKYANQNNLFIYGI